MPILLAVIHFIVGLIIAMCGYLGYLWSTTESGLHPLVCCSIVAFACFIGLMSTAQAKQVESTSS